MPTEFNVGMKNRILILAALSAFATAPALACSCMLPDSADQQMQGADLVFEGQVINVAPEKLQLTWWQRVQRVVLGPPEFEYRRDVTTFQVSREIKGKPGMNIAIVHLPGQYSATCGTSFARDETHVVIAYKGAEDGYFTTSSCSRAFFPNEAYQPPG